jgi:hypothetical protein
MDLQVGGATRFNVTKAGAAYGASFGTDSNNEIRYAANSLTAFANGVNVFQIKANAIRFINSFQLAWTDGTTPPSSNADLLLTRRGAANLRLGAADAAAPVAQTLSVQSVVAGTTNTAGTNLTITGSQGTGTGAGGSIVFQVAPAGTAGSTPNALATALTIGSDLSTTFAGTLNGPSSGGFVFSYGGSSRVAIGASGSSSYLAVRSDGGFVFSSTSAPSGTPDVLLFRDAANTLALRNGTAAQTFNVYNTYTSASVFERGFMRFVSNELQIGGEQTGGTDRGLAIVANASVNYMRSGGNWIFQSTNGGTGYFALSNGDAANRMIIRNAALTDAPLIQIGGTTSSFPALKRSTTFLQARLADDSAFAGFASANVQAATAYTVATLPTPTTGMIARVTDATAPVIGATVTGGGAAYALVNYNGANWTVIGV